MAETALFGIAKVVLEQLASPALKEFKLLSGHKTELESLEGTIDTIKNVLEDADRRQSGSETVRGWLARLRTVLYDADDLFDEVSYMVLHEKTRTGSKIVKQVSSLLSNHFVKTAQEVKAIRKRLDDIARDINQFGFLPSQPQADQEQPNRVRRDQTHSYVSNNEVVGRDQEREDIVKLLLPDNCEYKRGVSVVAVIGIGGLGKTTLGQFVYNDERVQQGFDLCMWCCVNYFSDLNLTLEAIIKSATNSVPHKGLDLDQVQRLLRKTLDGKRFLLVLDDVWDVDAQNWGRLRDLLDFGNVGSVVLATTRSVEVAQSMCAAKPYYRLQGLSDESAWLLFKKKAFGEESEEQNSTNLEKLGRQIVKKCGNAPLAIVIIASLLRQKESKEWFPLVNDELSKVASVQHDKTMQVLKISYNMLPSPVKRCFAYCSLFPKGYKFIKNELLCLWIAQGFVENCAAGQSLEDSAEGYFFYLVNICFLQAFRGCGFKMHDLVYDLASVVAGSESTLVDQTTPNFGDKTLRHVSVVRASDSLVDQLSSSSHSERLRTLFLDGPGILNIETSDKLMSSCFKAVRVLNLSSMNIKKIPDSVGQLIHLRYLDLSGNDMKMLPCSICMLHLLECLILHNCESLKKLPQELGKLMSLRRLETVRCWELSRMPAGLANLISLVTLDRLIVHSSSGGLRYLESLDNLCGSLTIKMPGTGWKNAAIDAQRSCLSKKHRLRQLSIEWDMEVSESELLVSADAVMDGLQPHINLESLEISHIPCKKMPPWMTLLQNLVSLEIESCERCVKLPPLRQLQSLKELKIGRMASIEVIEEDVIDSMSDNTDSIFFPSLQTLSISNMPNLTGWWKQSPSIQPAFCRVTKVEISYCPKLTTCVPLFPQVEVLVLYGIQEKLISQAIWADGTNMLKRLDLVYIHGLRLPYVRIKHLTSLEELKIFNCESLEWIDDDGDTERSEMPGGQLPRLKKLAIPVVDRNVLCKLFKYLTSLEELRVGEFEEELLQLKEEEEEEEGGMAWKSLQKLCWMRLGYYIHKDMALHLPKGVEYLASLQELTIFGCKELYLSWGVILSLHHLRTLQFERVEKVIDVGSAAVQRQLSCSLQELRIRDGSGELVHGIPWRFFPSLRSLRLFSISNMEALPEGIQHLTALEDLILSWCRNLVSLPSWMTHLSSLRSLQIESCTREVEERCKRGTGEDWPNIHHIPHITIKTLPDFRMWGEVHTLQRLLLRIKKAGCHLSCCSIAGSHEE